MLTPRVAFKRADCELFARYPKKVSFREELVPQEDREQFRDLRLRLKELAFWLAEETRALVGIPMKAEASLYSQNGRSQTDLWSCVYPEGVPNKSYALQLAMIISARGAELCLCLGAGRSQMKDRRKTEAAEAALAALKAALRETPHDVREQVSRDLDLKWELRTRWRAWPPLSDFHNLDDWLEYAASPDGNGASISWNLTPAELRLQRNHIGEELLELAAATAPLIAHAYKPLRSHRAPRTPSKPPVESKAELEAKLGALASELYVDAELLSGIHKLLEEKRQVVFYGPPGTGKTYVARKLIAALAPEEQQREIVQFHPSYSYERFVSGFRPFLTESKDLAYELQYGPLLRLAQRAAANPEKRFIMLIDEINRGDLAQIFGELLYLLEYRDERVALMYGPRSGPREPDDPIDAQGRFALPGNLWLVGTMNTADRSIALVDTALRRRFHFVPFFPGDAEGALQGLLDRWLRATQAPEVHAVAAWVDRLNELLCERFGRHLQIGHSYFMPREPLTVEGVERIWAHDIMPFLEDQLFDQASELKRFTFKAICRDARSNGASSEEEEEEEEHADDPAH